MSRVIFLAGDFCVLLASGIFFNRAILCTSVLVFVFGVAK